MRELRERPRLYALLAAAWEAAALVPVAILDVPDGVLAVAVAVALATPLVCLIYLGLIEVAHARVTAARILAGLPTTERRAP